MPKISMTFENDELEEFQLMMKASAMSSAISQIYQTARQQLKHGDHDRDHTALEAVRELAAQFIGE